MYEVRQIGLSVSEFFGSTATTTNFTPSGHSNSLNSPIQPTKPVERFFWKRPERFKGPTVPPSFLVPKMLERVLDLLGGDGLQPISLDSGKVDQPFAEEPVTRNFFPYINPVVKSAIAFLRHRFQNSPPHRAFRGWVVEINHLCRCVL